MDEDDKIAVIQTMKTVRYMIIFRIWWQPDKKWDRFSNAIKNGKEEKHKSSNKWWILEAKDHNNPDKYKW